MDKFLGILISIFVFIARLLPKFIINMLASLLASIIVIFDHKNTKLIRSNLSHIGTSFGYENPTKFAFEVFKHQIISTIESIQILYGKPYKVEGIEYFKSQFVENKSSFIIITAHFGSWELMGKLLASASPVPTFVLAKPSKYISATTWLESLRNRAGCQVIWVDQKDFFKNMIHQIQNKSTLGFVMDQKSKDRSGPKVEFFGKSTDFVSGPAKFAMKYHLPIIYCFCARIAPMHYKIISGRIDLAQHQTEEELTQAMAHECEKVIREHPEQWVWNYRKWPI